MVKYLLNSLQINQKCINYEYIDNYLNMLMNFEPDEYELIQSKMCSNEYIDNYAILNKNKHKGIKISVDLKHNEYNRVLYKEELTYKNFYNLQLNKKIYLDKINKIALNPFDSKRHWTDNINSVPYGYKI